MNPKSNVRISRDYPIVNKKYWFEFSTKTLSFSIKKIKIKNLDFHSEKTIVPSNCMMNYYLMNFNPMLTMEFSIHVK